MARDFRDRQSQIEMEMERRDGIWNEYAPTWDGASSAYYLARAQERLELARKTLEFVRAVRRPGRSWPRSSMRSSERVNAGAEDPASATGRDLFARAVDLRRRIIFSHPALDFDRLLLTKRPPPVLSAPGDNYYGINNGTGPGLVILDQWKTDRPDETVLLEGKLPPGCAMHPDLSFDGKRVVFAYADHTPPRDQWQFFLYEIHVDGTGLRQITGTDDDPLAGAGGRMTVLCEDYDPCYLPDGGFAFISTRNQGGVRCHNGDRYCPTYLLYRCDADGSNVRQLSFGEANEWDPTVMPDGQILWMRWDYINRPVIPTLGLWTIRPDGTAAEPLLRQLHAEPLQDLPGAAHSRLAQDRGHDGRAPHDARRVVDSHRPRDRRGRTGGHHATDAGGDLSGIGSRIRRSVSAARIHSAKTCSWPRSAPIRTRGPWHISAAQRLRDLPGRHAGRARVDLSRSRDLLLRTDARSAAADAAGAAVAGGRPRRRRPRASSTFRTSIRARKTFPAARSGGFASTS